MKGAVPASARASRRLRPLDDRSLARRLFLTCWIVVALHFATDFVREHYLMLSLGRGFSFRLDSWVGMHPDIFEVPGRGAFHGANPGASMLAAVPYALLRPALDRVEAWLSAARPASGGGEAPAVYDDPRPMRREFYRQVRRRGLDFRFGLAAGVATVLCMAPLTAAGTVVVFLLLRRRGVGPRGALALALLFLVGTPVLFRAAYLNQNLMIGLAGIAAFALLWPDGLAPAAGGGRRAEAAAGALGGFCLLCDYSGAIVLAALGAYCALTASGRSSSPAGALGRFTSGAAPPVALLWFYQWRCFGDPFLPPQHHMPPVEWIDIGYQGVGAPRLELIGGLLADPRYGLFVAGPLLALALAAPFCRGARRLVPPRELAFCLGLFAALLVFFGGVQYTRLQWVTGVRYLVPAVPFLFLPAAAMLTRMPRPLGWSLGLAGGLGGWFVAMGRMTEHGVHGTVVRVAREGLQLPWLSTLRKMSPQYAPLLEGIGNSVLPAFALAAVALAVLWTAGRGVPRPGNLPSGGAAERTKG